MKSKLLSQLREERIEAMPRLTPEERLRAYLAHCRLMSELYEAGRRLRSPTAAGGEAVRTLGPGGFAQLLLDASRTAP